MDALLERAAAGDRAAFDELVRPHLDALQSYVRRMIGHPEDTRDVAQDALLRAYPLVPRGRPVQDVALRDRRTPRDPALLVSVVVSFAFGSVWYGPIWSKTWQRAMGFEANKPTGAEIAKGSVINVVGTFLTAFVLAHEVGVWRPSAWNAGPDGAAAVYGFFAGLFTWLGFAVPVALNSVAFERKSWKVFGITTGYAFISYQIIAMILSFWR
jgi:hypothetical protein